MGIMSDLDGEKYAPFEPTAEEAKRMAQEYFRYVEETEEVPWQTDGFDARPIDLKDKELLVREKCARVAQRLRAQESNESR
jgi:hypothetical protein